MENIAKFIYVFQQEACDKLLARGFTLLKHDERNGLWVFENPSIYEFSTDEFRYINSNIISF